MLLIKLRTQFRPHLLLWIFMVGLSISAHASPAEPLVQITVLEKGSRKPIYGANVVLVEIDKYALSDEDGRASLVIPRYPVKLKIVAMGYQSKYVTLTGREDKPVVYLSQSAIPGESIVIMAERLPQQTSKISLSPAEINNTAGGQGDPVKVLDALPGVVTANEGTGVVYMRGSGSQDSVAWINQIPVGFLYHWGGLQSTINPDLVSDMNVFLGGFPVDYGDHLGGAIDVKLRTPQQERTHYDIHLGNYETSFSIEGPASLVSKNSGYYLAARRSYIDALMSPEDFTDFAESNTDAEERNQWVDVPEFYDVQAMFQQQLSKGKLEFSYFSAEDKLAFENNQDSKTDPELAGFTRYKYGYESLGSLWQQRWTKSVYHQIPIAYFRQYEDSQLGSDAQGKSFYSEAEVKTVFMRPEVMWHLNSDSQFSVGLETGFSDGDVDLYLPLPQEESAPPRDVTSSPKYIVKDSIRYEQYSPYMKHHKNWGNGLFTDLGLRYSEITSSGDIHMSGFSPRAAIEYKLTGNMLLLMSWGKYLQRPQIYELVPGFGNPKLDYTEAEHRILGFKYKMDRSWKMTMELYHKPMKNLTVRVEDQVPPDNILNKGKGNAYGLDFFIKRQLNRRNITWLSYSYLKSERTNTITGETYPFTGDQRHTLNIVWNRALSKNWDWSVKFQAHTGKPYTAVTGREKEAVEDPDSRWLPIYGSPYGERLPNYYKLNVRFDQSKVFNTWKMQVYYDVQLSNNVINYDYGSEYENYNNPEEIKTETLLFFIGIRAKF
ncbi:TonB-dependent receptor [Kaarinaea lacus]